MAIILDTTSIPGKTIVIEDTNGNIAIVPNDYTNELNSIKTSLDNLNQTVFTTTATGIDNVLTITTSVITDDHLGYFVEATSGIPLGTYIANRTVTGNIDDGFVYKLTVSQDVDGFSGTIKVVAPIIKLTEELTYIRQATQGIKTANTAVKEIVTGEQETIGAGIPFKDAYAGLSMSTLIKTLEEEKVNINNLIAKTKRYLDSV